MSYVLGNRVQRRLFFEGDSLSNRNSVGDDVNGHHFPFSVYAGRTYSGPLACFSYAVGGRSIADITALIETNITPYAREDDIIFFWAGTNSMGREEKTGAQAFADLETYVDTVLALGVILIVATTLARNGASDPADLQTQIDAFNVLIRNNAAGMGYTVCDLAANSLFNQEADCDNATYYMTDKIHLKNAAYGVLIPIAITTLNEVLAA